MVSQLPFGKQKSHGSHPSPDLRQGQVTQWHV